MRHDLCCRLSADSKLTCRVSGWTGLWIRPSAYLPSYVYISAVLLSVIALPGPIQASCVGSPDLLFDTSRPDVSFLQEMEHASLQEAGYRKLHALRLLKAAAAHLVLDGQQLDGRSPHSSSSNSMASTSSLGPLLRSFSNIEHVMPPQQRLSRTNSTDQPSPVPAGLPPRLGRSNSAGASRLGAFPPQSSSHMMVQPSSRQPAVSAAPALPSLEAVSQHSWPRAPRHSEPITGAVAGQDDRVEMLLTEVGKPWVWD